MLYTYALSVVAVVALASPAVAKRRPITLTLQGDLCSRVCQFSLCVDGEERRPTVTLCTPSEADMTVLVGHYIDGIPASPTTLKIRGTTVRLDCRADLLAACQQTCTADEDCVPNFAPSHCEDFTCTARPSCPPR
jgi:hypothetical protein